MLISQEFFDQCDPSYQTAINELELNLSSTDVEEEIEKLLDNFSSKYLMPKEYWSLYFSKFHTLKSSEDIVNMISKEIYHFCYQKDQHLAYEFYRKIINHSVSNLSKLRSSHCRIYAKNALMYPHKEHEELYLFYEEHASSLPTAAFIKRSIEMSELYLRIKAVENDVEQWFSILAEVDDKEFIIHNIEYRLGGNLVDKQLWKIYIKYLKDEGMQIELLHLYSKYSRFFLDDDEMKTEYEAEMKRYGSQMAVPWEVTFDFENKETWENLCEREKLRNIQKPLNPLPMDFVGVFYSNILPQVFSFRKPIIRYIINSASHIVLRKLHHSCKYFFLQKPTPICYNFEIPSPKTIFNNDRLTLNTQDEKIPIKNYYLITSLQVNDLNCGCQECGHLPHSFLSSITPLFYRCDAKYITIFNSSLTFNELKFFIKSGNVEKFIIYFTKVVDENGEGVSLEDFLIMLPKIREFYMRTVKWTSETAEILANLKFQNKITKFNLDEIYGIPLNLQKFKEFCSKTFDEVFEMRFSFQEDYFTEDFGNDLREMMITDPTSDSDVYIGPTIFDYGDD